MGNARASSFLEKYFWLVFGGVWLVVGVPFLAIGVGVIWSESRLQRQIATGAHMATGRVLVKSRGDSSKSSSVTYHVSYRFQTTSGKKVYGESEIAPEAFDQLVEQGPVVIRYLADEPDFNWIQKPPDRQLLGWIFSLLGGVFTLLGGAVFLIEWRGRRKRRGKKKRP
ncbi:MAG: DUF3592 domain-containing protein [Acidobacteria bacterium]|nr:DUF3592 domain-containing protein [Acidobacteriota bacterium]